MLDTDQRRRPNPSVDQVEIGVYRVALKSQNVGLLCVISNRGLIEDACPGRINKRWHTSRKQLADCYWLGAGYSPWLELRVVFEY